LASHTHGRTAGGSKRHGGAGRGIGGSVALGGRCPERIGLEWAEVGPRAGPKGCGDLGQHWKFQRKSGRADMAIGPN
jgi:hypothetical protein